MTFVLAGLLLLMACVKADRVRAWHASRIPSAPELSGASFVVTRLALVTMAVAAIVVSFQVMWAQDDTEWSDDELTSAVEEATRSLDGSSAYGDSLTGPDEPEDFEGKYARRIKDEIARYSAAVASQSDLDVALAEEPTANRARYEISALGADVTFCMDVTRTHTGTVETVAPGGIGASSKLELPEFTYALKSRPGMC